MDMELNARHRQVLGLEKLRRKRDYREGWLYHLCLQKGLLKEMQELQLAGLVGDASVQSRGPLSTSPAASKGAKTANCSCLAHNSQWSLFQAVAGSPTCAPS